MGEGGAEWKPRHLCLGRTSTDASSVQAPGAKGIDHRLHLAMDLVSLEFIEVLVSDVHTGDTLKPFTLGPGDVALTDRGDAQAQGMSDAVKRGAALIVRLNPFSVVLTDRPVLSPCFL
jgi:hypothetical protein